MKQIKKNFINISNHIPIIVSTIVSGLILDIIKKQYEIQERKRKILKIVSYVIHGFFLGALLMTIIMIIFKGL